jgi:peptidoglycan/LPS O-acetylase OafA/YrhL
VVLFHAGISLIPGGFVGVDVFFVISGYLITALLLNDIAKDRFSIARFYEGRVRRILPALFAMLIGASLAAYVLLMPEDAKSFGQSLVATVLFSSNILFWKQTGYFQAPAELKPLLHTWSLAVEEQFYIVYPLFLFVVGRYLRKKYTVALLSVLGLSLALSIWGAYHAPVATFYLAPARAWELLLGGLLAIKMVPPLRHRVSANAVGFLGLGLLFYSFVALSPSVPFPGANALYPTIGAALIIYSGTETDTIVAKLLSFKPLAFVGLISYSLYLWHWVLIVFLKCYLVRPLTLWEIAAEIAASFLIATLSWKFVENPFRGRQPVIGGSRRLLFSGAAFGSIILASFGGLLYAKEGLPSRFNQQVLGLLAGKNDYWKRLEDCTGKICRIGDENVAPSFILWGDSHAGALAPLFESIAVTNKVSGYVATHNACAPLMGFERYNQDNVEKCTRFNDSVLEFIKSHQIKTVFLHGRWALYVEGRRYKQEPGATVMLTPNRKQEENYHAFEILLRSTLEELRRLQINVIVIASVPEVGMDVPTVLAHNAMTGRTVKLEPSYSDFTNRQARTFEVLSRVTAEYGVALVYPHKFLCDNSSCSVLLENQALYQDTHHLTADGAMYLLPEFSPLLMEEVLEVNTQPNK